MSDDFSSDTVTTGMVAVDGSATGSIEEDRDADWFRVILVAGQTYQDRRQGQADRGRHPG